MRMDETESKTPLRVLILGANSGIAEATARLYAVEGASLLLVGRNAEPLQANAAELLKLGAAKCQIAVLDLAGADQAVELPRLAGLLDGVDHIHIAYAIMPEQS